ncbi:MAG TPA: EAL domain-containing protein [Polyangiaceae bacterium]|jgi:EAL domain-containing protein (putative c-di-GMP-specific phosphodiesterase class I)|nr:EAL domain-containing protein [Polyangiaceae bacterium]
MNLGGATDPCPAPRVAARVLVADDEPGILRLVTRILTSAGFEVIPARNGVEAARLLAQETFDAVLTDVTMPQMTGVELLRVARATDLDVPILLMTGAPDIESATEAVRQGACDYISKPFLPIALERSVRRAVDLSQLARARRDAMRFLGGNHPAASDRAGLEVTFARALESFWMAYQPITSAGTGEVFGYEALLRSDEPALPNPGSVLEAAERLGRLDELGQAIRAKAPAPLARAPYGAALFINLHPRDLCDSTLTAHSTPLAAIASRVVLEITERASLDDVPEARTKVAELREMGFRIALDDLGAGYAGLTSFAQLEPEFVKLDMSLVRDIHKSSVKQKLVRSMTELCKDMGVTVIAEGIELEEERDSIVDLDCDLLQGYFVARPGPAFPEVLPPH